jgi:hypothetical protein
MVRSLLARTGRFWNRFSNHGAVILAWREVDTAIDGILLGEAERRSILKDANS